MASLTPLQLRLDDAVNAAAERLLVPLDDAPHTVWRLAIYGGHVAHVPSSEARAELNAALELSRAAGAWIRRDSNGYAEAVNLVEWRETTPSATLHRVRSAIRDRFSPTPSHRVELSPIHARRGAGLTLEAATFCAPNIAVNETEGRLVTVALPNNKDDWCIACEQGLTALFNT